MLLRGSAICLATCWLISAIQMVKRRGILRALSSRIHPAQRTSPLPILFIDLLLFKLETSQVVEVRIYSVLRVPLPPHRPICSRYSGCPAPIVPLFPLRQLMASVGPQMYSRLPPTLPPPGPSSLSSPLPRVYIIMPTFCPPHVFRFNGCWSV